MCLNRAIPAAACEYDYHVHVWEHAFIVTSSAGFTAAACEYDYHFHVWEYAFIVTCLLYITLRSLYALVDNLECSDVVCYYIKASITKVPIAAVFCLCFSYLY